MSENFVVADMDEGMDMSSMPPSLYQYYSSLEKRRIVLNSEMDSSLIETVMLPLIDMDADGTNEPIEIVVSTPGGTVADTLCLCNIIDKLKTPTTIRIMGCAYSAGVILVSAGYDNPNVKKVCYPFSSALFHAGDICVVGEAGSVKDTLLFTEKLDQQIKEYILTHSKITREEYEANERKQWYLTSDEMLRLGLVDAIL